MRISMAVLAVAVLGGVFVAGGCVSQAEHDQIKVLNRKALDAKNEAMENLRKAELENTQLKDELAARDQIIAIKKAEIGLLDAKNEALAKTLFELEEKYRDAIAAGTVPAIGEIRVLPTAVDAALVKFAAENPDLVEYLPKYGMVKIKADMTFAKGSAEVTAAAAAALTKLAEIANSPDAKAFNVYIAGHTDDIPIRKAETLREHKNNWGLSVHRSLAVIKVLFQAGVDQKRMGAMGFSKYHPVEPNELGNRGNPTNRRVEIWLVPPNRFLTGSVAAEADK